ncbi:MAG: helix-hairpin-helix domain-containing protein [Candidatus Omnitrophica bacterium]|nr:helix-hairpin-helix domain-containing protein [Candidatus Omnitrophota bacterium]
MIERFTRQELMAIALVCSTGFAGLALARLDLRFPGETAATMPLTISLNHASARELASLPGIGPALAKRIVQDRQLHGKFLRIADLTRVRGISPKLTAQLKPRLRLE